MEATQIQVENVGVPTNDPTAHFDRLPAGFVHGRKPPPMVLALRDLRSGLLQWPLWTTLGWQDIRQRYRRSMLGPFWMTLSMAAMMGGLGFLYAGLFKQDVSEYLPYLGLGLLSWGLINQLVLDGCNCMISAESLAKQVKLPFSIHVYRSVWRNVIVFGHNMLVYVAVALIFRIWPGVTGLLLAAAAMTLILLNGVWISLLLGMICARFRDVGQIVGSLIQIVFFMSPIVWVASSLPPARRALVEFNPVYHFIEIFRAPLLDKQASLENWEVSFGVTAVGMLITFVFFARFRARLAYWL